MALYLGEAVRVQATPLDADTKLPLEPPLSAVVEFWAPGRNPIRDTTIRVTPDVGPAAMTYRTDQADFIQYQSTDGNPWVAGRWIFRATVTGPNFVNWEYGNFTLRP